MKTNVSLSFRGFKLPSPCPQEKISRKKTNWRNDFAQPLGRDRLRYRRRGLAVICMETDDAEQLLRDLQESINFYLRSKQYLPKNPRKGHGSGDVQETNVIYRSICHRDPKIDVTANHFPQCHRFPYNLNYLL